MYTSNAALNNDVSNMFEMHQADFDRIDILSRPALDHLNQHGLKKCYGKGQVIFQEGNDSNSAY